MDEAPFPEKTRVLMRAAELLHRHGTPSHRLERVMKRVSLSLGIEADYLYTPTSLLVSFNAEQQHARLMRIDAGPVDLGKLWEFDEALENLEHRRATVTETSDRLEAIAAAPHRFREWELGLASGVASACATVFLGGGGAETATAFGLGLLVHGLNLLLKWLAPQERLLEAMAGFMCAMLAIATSAFVFPLDDRLATLGSLIVLLPGLSLTIAMTELANRHLSSGVSRLAGAGVVFLTLAVGVALAWRLGSSLRPLEIVPTPWPLWAKYVTVGLAPFSFIVLFQARIQDWVKICPVAWLGFLAADSMNALYGAEWAAFVGAATVGVLSNLYARCYNRPALIPQIPAILMLVPGSLGYLSVTAFIDQDGIQGVESAFNMALVAMSLAGGLLVANAFISPRRFL